MFNHLPKYKLSLRIFLIFSVCASLILSILHFSARGQSQTLVYLDPRYPEVNIGEETLINVKIDNVSGLYSFQISLTYDENILQYQGVSEGSFLNAGGAVTTFRQEPRVESGKILGYAVSRQGGISGVNGSGNLATFRFLAKNRGGSDLAFVTSGSYRLKLINSALDLIPHDHINAKITVKQSSDASPPPNIPPPPSIQEAKFNFMPEDNKTLRIKNRTRNDSSWAGAISANPGDKVTFNVYYHNGIEGSVAKNTKIKLTFPETSQTSITVKMELGADNAPTVTDSVMLNLPNPQKLTFNNLAQWYPNRTGQNPQNRSLALTNTGITLILDNIKGCWEYQGQVIFEAELTSIIPQNTLELKSEIKNLSQNSNWGSSVAALPTEEISFRIEVKAKNYALNNVIIKDQLPGNLIYQTNSLNIVGAAQKSGNLFDNTGLNVGTIKAGNNVTISFKAKVASLSTGQYTLTNNVSAQADGISQKQENNTVNISYSGCSPGLKEPGPDAV